MRRNDRREKIRVGFKTRIVIETGSSRVQTEGSSKDLSLSGIFVNTNERIPTGTSCQVKILVLATTDPLVIQMDGRIVRSVPSGFAISFSSMDIDSYTHLKNVIRYNAENPDGAF
jgi:hypothetical protein